MNFFFSILIVEDELLIAQDLKEILEEVGYQHVFRVSNYQQAIDILECQNIDLVLLDINLNGTLSGIDLADYINQHQKIPFVYITSYSDAGTIKGVKQTRPAGFLLKPYSKELLLIKIELALFNYSMQINAAEQPSQLGKTVDDQSDVVINNYLLIKENYLFIKVPLAAIWWFESDKNYVTVKTEERKYVMRSSLKKLQETLPATDFVKCHKQFIINIRHAGSFGSNTVNIYGHSIPISRNMQDEVLAKLKQSKSVVR